MDFKAIEEKLSKFFKEVDARDLISEFQGMGYEFESITNTETIEEIEIDVSLLVLEIKNSDNNINNMNMIISKNDESFTTENSDDLYDYSSAA